MTKMIKNNKYTDLGKERLPYIFYGEENFDKFIEIFGSWFDNKINIINILELTRSISNSSGVYLDYIGNFYNFPRPNEIKEDDKFFILSYEENQNSSLTYGDDYTEDMKPFISSLDIDIRPISDEFYRKYLIGFALLGNFIPNIPNYTNWFKKTINATIKIELQYNNLPANTRIIITSIISEEDLKVVKFFIPKLQPLSGKIILSESELMTLDFDNGELASNIFSGTDLLNFS